MADPNNNYRGSSVPLSGGGDTHIHTYGSGENDFTITSRIPLGDGFSVGIHDNPLTGDSDFSIKDN